MRKLYLMKKHYRHIISEVYLLKDGETLEIVYLNKFWVSLQIETQIINAIFHYI